MTTRLPEIDVATYEAARVERPNWPPCCPSAGTARPDQYLFPSDTSEEGIARKMSDAYRRGYRRDGAMIVIRHPEGHSWFYQVMVYSR